jgi:hypothetical protein
METAVGEWLQSIDLDLKSDGIFELVLRWEKYVVLGNFVEK